MSFYSYDPNSLEKHGKSFYWASFFLPNKNKNAASELYSICRYFDDLADKVTTDQSEKLKSEFEKICNNVEHPINKFFKSNNIPIQILGDLIQGLIQDQKLVRIQTEKDLIEYSYQVAGTVGLMMQPLILVKNKDANKHAVDLGIAMQLTNIARDVVEDEKKNRVYLIKSSNDAFKSIKNIILKADSFYESSFVGIKDIPLNSRFSIIVARRVYRQIGKKILSKKDIESYREAGKIYVSKIGKIIQTLFALKDLIILFFVKNKKYEREIEYNLINEDIGLNERI